MGSLSNGDLFDGSSNKRSLYNGYCTSSGVSLKYKKRKVYAVRHFPHGCGQNALFINLMPQDTEVVASLGDKGNLVADEKMVKVPKGDCVKASEIGSESSSHQLVESSVKLELPNILNDLLGKVVVAAGKVNGAELSPIVEPLGSGLPKALENNALELSKELHEVEVQAVVKSECAPESKIVLEIISMADGMVPSSGAKTWFPPEWPISDGNVSKETNLKAKYFRRRVRAIREFPPFCGINVICPTEEEHLRIVLGNKTSVAPVEAAVQGKQIIGSVPGVDVGDEFQYWVELALVGIHRLYEAGIDYMKHGGMIIATSIVASGGYADDLDNPDVLIYFGHGGNITGRDKQQPKDQKLERGNLALKNSISAKNPVRVIHGSKETKLSTLDARAKIVLTYTYNGLYTVERYTHDIGPHGKLVFKFELKRIPGQPELAWKEVKKSKRFKIWDGLCVGDISRGKELFPICAVNTIDNKRPPKFNYITEMKYPDWYCLTTPKGCDCIGGCLDSKKCSCMFNNGGKIPYNCNGAIVEAKPLLSSSEVVEDERFTVDAEQCGNVGRFINHSCSPNLYAQNVLYDHEDKSKPHIMLFAAENIPPLKELTCHYNYLVYQVRDSNGNIKMKSCYCGAVECTGRMY
ncbi:hypothetical protein ACSBR2_039692 [Camellia fascicularis]